jgi:hypothetical protein
MKLIFTFLAAAACALAQYTVNVSGVTSAGPKFVGTVAIDCPAIVTPDGMRHPALSSVNSISGGQLNVSLFPTDWSVPTAQTPCSIVYSSGGQQIGTKGLTITAAMAGTSVTWGQVEGTQASVSPFQVNGNNVSLPNGTLSVGAALPSRSPSSSIASACLYSPSDEANVLCYGADPTGTTDSDAAFSAASATGRTVRVPNGTFKITACWTMPIAGVVGTGKLSIIQMGSVGQSCTVQVLIDSTAYYAGAKSVSYRDFTADANSLSTTAILLASTFGATLQNVQGINAVQDGIRFDQSISPVGNNDGTALMNCVAFGNGRHGIAAPSVQSDNNLIYVYNGLSAYNLGDGMLVKGNGWIVTGGDFYGNTGYGIQLGEDSDGGTTSGHKIDLPSLENDTAGYGYSSAVAMNNVWYVQAGANSGITGHVSSQDFVTYPSARSYVYRLTGTINAHTGMAFNGSMAAQTDYPNAVPRMIVQNTAAGGWLGGFEWRNNSSTRGWSLEMNTTIGANALEGNLTGVNKFYWLGGEYHGTGGAVIGGPLELTGPIKSHTNQLAGTIVITNPATVGTTAFSTRFSSAPICTIAPTSSQATGIFWVTSTNAAVSANVSSAPASAQLFNYICIGNPN